MKVNRTLSAILNGIWAIEPHYAQSQLPIVAQIIKGQSFGERKAYHDDYDPVAHHSQEAKSEVGGVKVFRKSSRWASFKNAEPGSIAVIPISGPMMKEGECGEPGSALWGNWVREADQHPNISSIVIAIDSPGGTVNGTATLADAIKGTRKKITAFIDDGMAASAAYWIASAADEVVLSQPTDEVGSIGVFMTLADWYGYFEAEGLKVKDIYASQSSEKNKVFMDALNGNEKPLKAQQLDPIAARFISTVKNNRAGKLNLSAGDPFKGRLYMAEEAIEIGLADRIASFEEVVVGLAGSTSNGSGNVQSSKSNSKIMAKGKWPQVASAVAVEAFESTNEGVYLSTEQMDALNAELDRDVVEATELTNAQQSIETLEQGHTADLDAVNQQLEALGEAPVQNIQQGTQRLGELALEYGRASGAVNTKAKTDKKGEEEGDETDIDKMNAELHAKAGIDPLKIN